MGTVSSPPHLCPLFAGLRMQYLHIWTFRLKGQSAHGGKVLQKDDKVGSIQTWNCILVSFHSQSGLCAKSPVISTCNYTDSLLNALRTNHNWTLFLSSFIRPRWKHFMEWPLVSKSLIISWSYNPAVSVRGGRIFLTKFLNAAHIFRRNFADYLSSKVLQAGAPMFIILFFIGCCPRWMRLFFLHFMIAL